MYNIGIGKTALVASGDGRYRYCMATNIAA